MATTKDEMLAAAREAAPQIDVQRAKELIEAGAVTVDVRESNEFIEGRIPGAINIPRGVLEFKLDHPALEDKDKDIVICCKSGARGALAAKTLVELGYSKVTNLAGGFKGWCEAGESSEVNPEIC